MTIASPKPYPTSADLNPRGSGFPAEDVCTVIPHSKRSSSAMRPSVICTVALLLMMGELSPGLAQDEPSEAAVDLTYAVGADLSFLKAAEDQGVEFRDEGEVKPGLQIFREHGYDWIRLRLFHSQ